MKLRSLDVRRLPGIDAPFRLAAELGARVTVIQGPNGSGKSSVCRAIRALLWPKSEPSPTVEIAATFVHEGAELCVERFGSHVAWTKDGASARAPELPPDHLSGCYTIAGDDLLGEEAERRGAAKFARKDGQLAAEIARELSGGFDLRVLRADLAPPARLGATEEKALRDAQEELSRVTRAHTQLHEEAEQIVALRSSAQLAEQAAARARVLDVELELARLRGRMREHTAQLDAFEPGMEHLRGEELTELRARRDQLARERDAVRKADESVAEARAQIAAANLAGDGPSSVVLDAQRKRLHGLEKLETELRRALVDEANARARREERRRALDPEGQGAVDLAADRESLDSLDRHVRRAQELVEERAEIQAQLARLESQPTESDLDAVGAGARELARWLAGPPAPSARFDRAHGVLLALLVVTSVVLGALLHGAWFTVPLVALLVLLTRRAASPSARSACETAFAALGLPPPAGWTEAAVQRRHQELTREIAQLELARERRELRERVLARARELEVEEREHAAERERLREALGVDAGAHDLSLAVIAANLIAFQSAQEETAACLEQRQQLEHDRANLARTIARFLESFEPLAGDDASTLGAALESLAQRADAVRRATGDLRNAETMKREAERRSSEVERSIEDLFARAMPRDPADPATPRDLERDERALARRLERLPAWRKIERQLADARAQAQALAAKLGGAHAEGETAERSEDAIRAELAEAQSIAAGRDALVRRIQHIQTRVGETRAAHGLEEALAKVATAREALAEKRERALDDAVLDGLLAQIEDEERQTAQSPIFRRAATWFAKFTHYAYELQLGATGARGGEPTFQAFETAARKVRTLDELSTGTRSQLLLAARIAFAIEAERGAKLPLFLDEALLAADPERFNAVAESLALLAREEDRQIVYLTSDPTDARRWQLIEPDVAVVDLASVRRFARVSERPLAPLDFERVSIEGLSPAELAAALGVGAPDPWQEPDAVHVYHLVGAEPSRMQALLDQHVETLGAARALARSASQRISAADFARLDAWGEIYATFAQSWRTGRGKPITRDVLEAAGVTDKFLEPVCAMAAELAWDGKRLVHALNERADARLRNMHKTTVQRIEDYLAAEGHYDARDPLTEHAIIEHAIAAASDGILPAEIAARVKHWCRALQPKPARARTMDMFT